MRLLLVVFGALLGFFVLRLVENRGSLSAPPPVAMATLGTADATDLHLEATSGAVKVSVTRVLVKGREVHIGLSIRNDGAEAITLNESGRMRLYDDQGRTLVPKMFNNQDLRVEPGDAYETGVAFEGRLARNASTLTFVTNAVPAQIDPPNAPRLAIAGIPVPR